MEVVGRKLTFAEAQEEDDRYWANASVEERLAETERLRREYYTGLLGKYPDKMEKVGRVVSKHELDEDDF
jgi:hypothetical protein